MCEGLEGNFSAYKISIRFSKWPPNLICLKLINFKQNFYDCDRSFADFEDSDIYWFYYRSFMVCYLTHP